MHLVQTKAVVLYMKTLGVQMSVKKITDISLDMQK